MDKQKPGGRKSYLAVAVLLVLAGVLALVWWTMAPKGQTGAKTVTVQVIHKDGSTREFTLETEEAYLGPALVEGKVVENDQSSYGLYILTADGETADGNRQEWWRITRSGQRLDTGADSTPIADGETYELTLTVGYGS